MSEHGFLKDPDRLRGCVEITFFVITFQVTRSVQAERDTESRKINYFWIPASAGMTTLMVIPAITTQFVRGNDRM